MSYTYQTLTAKPVIMSENTVSLMELIAAGHAVALPHDAGVRVPKTEYFVLPEESTYDWLITTCGQALCGMARVTGH